MNETKNYGITKSGAVILEGGANRGVFTAGALDFLMEQEYYIPHVIGVSAGACNALDYVSRQIGRTRDCMIVTDEKNRYVNKNIKTIVEKKDLRLPKQVVNVIKCKNPRCITSIEQGLDQIFVLADKEKEVYRCKYCEEKYTGKRNK